MELLRRGWITGQLSNGNISIGDTYNLLGKYIIRNALGTLPEYKDIAEHNIYINIEDNRCYCDIQWDTTSKKVVMVSNTKTRRWKFMIDEQYQNKGYGKKALKLAIDWLLHSFNIKEVYTGVAFGNTIAEKLYYYFGFRRTGEFDESQIEMKLIIES